MKRLGFVAMSTEEEGLAVWSLPRTEITITFPSGWHPRMLDVLSAIDVCGIRKGEAKRAKVIADLLK